MRRFHRLRTTALPTFLETESPSRQCGNSLAAANRMSEPSLAEHLAEKTLWNCSVLRSRDDLGKQLDIDVKTTFMEELLLVAPPFAGFNSSILHKKHGNGVQAGKERRQTETLIQYPLCQVVIGVNGMRTEEFV